MTPFRRIHAMQSTSVPARRFHAPRPSTGLLTAGLVAFAAAALPSAAFAPDASAQTLTPVAPPPGFAPQAAPPKAPPLPPALSEAEQRYRDLAAYIRSRGSIDAALRTEIARLAADLDAAIDAAGTTDAQRLRLLPARAQTAVWLLDEAALDAAFERLLALAPSGDAVALAWANECILDGRFERAVSILRGRAFGEEKSIDARLALSRALFGLLLLDEAQAELDAVPREGLAAQQAAAIGRGTRRIREFRERFSLDQASLARDLDRDDNPIVEFTTTRGPVVVELFENDAPETVGHFVEHVESGTYTGTSVHGVLRGFGVLAGDPATRDGAAGGRSTGGWLVRDEGDLPSHRATITGRLVLAKQPDPSQRAKPAPNSAGCQFMILLCPAPQLDGDYTAFGRVVDGMDIVRRLREGDQILAAEVVRKREHPYRANRLAEVETGTFTRPLAVDAPPPARSGTAPPVPALNPNAPSLSPSRP